MVHSSSNACNGRVLNVVKRYGVRHLVVLGGLLVVALLLHRLNSAARGADHSHHLRNRLRYQRRRGCRRKEV